MRKYRISVVAILATFFSLMLTLVCLSAEGEGKIEIMENDTQDNNELQSIAIPSLAALDEEIPTDTLEPMPENEESSSFMSPGIAPKVVTNAPMASITISTDTHKRMYDILPNVDEGTLINNIGWLPGSVLPGEEGLCVLMGHRDTNFRILRNIGIGDRLGISMNGMLYTYQVSEIIITESDNELKFKAQEGSILVLVTCYPFRYTGHAPQKFVMFAIGIQCDYIQH